MVSDTMDRPMHKHIAWVAAAALTFFLLPPAALEARTKLEEVQSDPSTSSFIVDGTVATPDLADGAVSTLKLAADAEKARKGVRPLAHLLALRPEVDAFVVDEEHPAPQPRGSGAGQECEDAMDDSRFGQAFEGNQHDPCRALNAKAGDVAEVMVQGQQHLGGPASMLEQLLISGSVHADIHGTLDMNTGFTQGLDDVAGDAVVCEDPHPSVLDEYAGGFFAQPRGELNRGQRVLAADAGVLLGDLVNRIAGRQQVQDVGDRDPGAPDARLSKANLRINRDARHRHIQCTITHRQMVCQGAGKGSDPSTLAGWREGTDSACEMLATGAPEPVHQRGLTGNEVVFQFSLERFEVRRDPQDLLEDASRKRDGLRGFLHRSYSVSHRRDDVNGQREFRNSGDRYLNAEVGSEMLNEVGFQSGNSEGRQGP